MSEPMNAMLRAFDDESTRRQRAEAEIDRLRVAMEHAMNALEAEQYGEAWTCLKVTLTGGTDDV